MCSFSGFLKYFNFEMELRFLYFNDLYTHLFIYLLGAYLKIKYLKKKI